MVQPAEPLRCGAQAFATNEPLDRCDPRSAGSHGVLDDADGVGEFVDAIGGGK